MHNVILIIISFLKKKKFCFDEDEDADQDLCADERDFSFNFIDKSEQKRRSEYCKYIENQDWTFSAVDCIKKISKQELVQ